MLDKTVFHGVCGVVFGGIHDGRGGLKVCWVCATYFRARDGQMGFGSREPSVIRRKGLWRR